MAIVRLEPQIPAWGEFATLPQIKSVMVELRSGQLYNPTLLVERLLENPRLLGAVNTRINGLLSSKIEWEPGKNNREGRRAARDIEVDFPRMAPTPQRRQFAKTSLLLGFGLGQRVPIPPEMVPSGRELYRLRPYWSGFAAWNWATDAYRVQARDGEFIDVRSPSFDIGAGLAPADSQWIVAEPNGEYSWREGLILGLYKAAFGHDLSLNYLNTAAMKFGVGVTKVKFPTPRNDEEKALQAQFIKDYRAIGSNGAIPLQQREDGTGGYDLEPFEFQNGGGADVIDRALNTAAIAMAIVLLGHNLTTEVKGGSYAAAGVGEYIRTDIKVSDAGVEWATLGPQLICPWAEANYRDPEVTPRACYVADPPTVNKQRAETLNQLAMATTALRANVPRADVNALCEQFGIPLLDETQVQVPATAPVPGAPPPAPDPESPGEGDAEGGEPADPMEDTA